MAIDSYICPTCGSEVKVGAACPGCGPRKPKRKRRKAATARKRKPWEQDSIYDGLGLADEEFDYEEFVQKEFKTKPHQAVGIKWYWWVTAIALLMGFGIMVLAGAIW